METSKFSAQNGTIKANLICHYLQGHTHHINRTAASLLAAQLISGVDFDDYSGLFKNDDINQQSAYQMALALYIHRSDQNDVIELAVNLLQEIIISRGWESASVVILERLLSTIGDLSFKLEIEADLIDKVKKLINHQNEKVKLAAVKCLADLAASPNLAEQALTRFKSNFELFIIVN